MAPGRASPQRVAWWPGGSDTNGSKTDGSILRWNHDNENDQAVRGSRRAKRTGIECIMYGVPHLIWENNPKINPERRFTDDSFIQH